MLWYLSTPIYYQEIITTVTITTVLHIMPTAHWIPTHNGKTRIGTEYK